MSAGAHGRRYSLLKAEKLAAGDARAAEDTERQLLDERERELPDGGDWRWSRATLQTAFVLLVWLVLVAALVLSFLALRGAA